MAEAVLEIVLENLNSLIQKELRLFCGFDQEMKRLANLFTAIKATLEDAAEKQYSERAIKDWLGKLKEAAYILDDILDECAYEALGLEYQGVNCGLPDKVQSSCLSSFHPNHVVFRYEIAKKMKRISERLHEIAQEKKFHLTVMVPERISGDNEWRQTTSFITEPQVYGREEDKNRIVDLLVASQSEDLQVYPIVGLGGVEKTTLAQLIFNHERVINHFELRIWVCVSEDFSLKRMTRAIIEATSGWGCEDVDLEPLQRRLQELLQTKRYLLVLDDVWDDKLENWQKLKPVLACGAMGASILVTTRLAKVARIMGTVTPYDLSLLPDDNCWELFKYHAFRPNEGEQSELDDIGKRIAKKCGGVPLAAKALGGLLHSKTDKREWLNVIESNLLKISESENLIMRVLKLSYLHLPIKFRQCFAFCAIFPKDEKIEKQYLIDLWMANGFISSNEGLDSKDVGDGVWNELYWRSFFQDIETDDFSKVASFKMHDLVHDLAQSVAEEVCCITYDNGVTTLSERIHHLLDRTDKAINRIQLHPDKSLRTFISSYHTNTDQLYLHVLKCYSLRVLHCETSELSSKIGHLKHLRYLNLCQRSFKTLPESLCELWNLLILILDNCRSLQKLPNSLVRLKSLQKLSFIGCSSLSSLPSHIGKLTSLRNLTMYYVGKEKGFLLAELRPLKLKGDLDIKHLENVKSVMDAEEANMSSKQLHHLSLSWGRNEESELQENVEQILEALQPDTQHLQSLWVEGYNGAHFPQWMSCPSLKQLHICRRLKFNVSLGFQWLTCLQSLRIDRCREVEGLHETLQHMSALKKLALCDLPNLESLPDCFGNLPLLHELTISKCFKLTCLPTSLSLSNLKILLILDCPVLQKRCHRQTREDRQKIAHIPDIMLLAQDRWAWLTEVHDTDN